MFDIITEHLHFSDWKLKLSEYESCISLWPFQLKLLFPWPKKFHDTSIISMISMTSVHPVIGIYWVGGSCKYLLNIDSTLVKHQLIVMVKDQLLCFCFLTMATYGQVKKILFESLLLTFQTFINQFFCSSFGLKKPLAR